MSNKTCGECSWFSDNRCNLHNNQYIFGDRVACKDFKQQPTNGDKLASDRNYMAAVIIAASGKICHFCAYYVNKKCTALEDKNCFHGVVNWLNAPADCVKQNGDHDTQAYLCEADYTESEVEDE